MPLRPGDAVRIELTKWVDRPHWVFDGTYLGTDRHGDWLGFAAGTLMARPGLEVRPSNDQVGLVPAAGDDADRGWLATFHGPGGAVQTYVDMTTPAYWDGHVVRAVDLDLDVIKTLGGEVVVDDQDEFDRHRVEHAYPTDLVELAEHSRDRVLAAVRAGRPPFDDSFVPWLDRFLRLLER